MRAVSVLLPVLLAGCAVSGLRPPVPCRPGAWISPVTLRPVADPVPGAAATGVVLLGESHDNRADHAWELATIERLYAVTPRLSLGFEMFPRSVQPVLDRWVTGQLSEAAFLTQSGWKAYWGFDPAMYLPMFRFARDHRLPMLALNVSHRLTHAVAQKGWDGVPVDAREGVGTPAPVTAAYRASLADAMGAHMVSGSGVSGSGAGGNGGSGRAGPAMTPARLQHFIDAQSVWDRAMAEGIASARARDPGRTVVAIMGAGHLEERQGVPHQLAALGVPDAVVLLPTHGMCEAEDAGFADAEFAD